MNLPSLKPHPAIIHRAGASTQNTRLSRGWIEECSDGNDDIRCTEQRALEIITPAVQHQEIDNESRDKQRNSFEESEVE